MRFGFFSDVDGDYHAMERALQLLSNAEKTVFLGDVAGGREVAECIDLLLETGVESVAGNHDRWDFEWVGLSKRHAEFLGTLPLTIEFPEFLALHSYFEECRGDVRFRYLFETTDAELLFRSNPYRLFFVGHTHRSQVFELSARGELSATKIESETVLPLQSESRYIVNVGAIRESVVLYDSERHELEFMVPGADGIRR